MDERREAAWKAGIAKRKRGEDVPLEEHYALLREGMFNEGNKVDVKEEAFLFLEYWLHGLRIEDLPSLGEAIANHWFELRRREKHWEEALRDFVAADDFDHWRALNLIAARLHRERQPFPDTLADWAADLHEGKRKPPAKERGNRGQPPYARQDRNRTFYMADTWLKHYGMASAGARRDCRILRRRLVDS